MRNRKGSPSVNVRLKDATLAALTTEAANTGVEVSKIVRRLAEVHTGTESAPSRKSGRRPKSANGAEIGAPKKNRRKVLDTLSE